MTCSDGSPMTAADVVFSYEMFRDKGIAETPRSNQKFQSVGGALDDYTGKFVFTPGTLIPRYARDCRAQPDNHVEGRLRGQQARSGRQHAEALPRHQPLCSTA